MSSIFLDDEVLTCRRIGRSQLKQDELVTILKQSGMRAWNSCLLTFLDPIILGGFAMEEARVEPPKCKHLGSLQQRIDALLGYQL